tara:strand:- start:49 stop:444 length:396 start_codon:yes stop_codon:yes gene_type:complete
MKKYFYFRTEAAVADDDDIARSVMIPVDSLLGMYPTSDTALTVTFTPVNAIMADGQDGAVVNSDKVVLNVNTNAHREVMYAIANAANASASTKDGVITVADDATDDNNAAAVYLHADITSCGAITLAADLS